MTPLFELPTWSPQAVESIRELYPRKINKKAELKKIEDALTRIVNGEIDGTSRSPEQAILYLREQTNFARQSFAGREKQYIPHATTFYNQRRYLQYSQALTLEALSPDRVKDAVTILFEYPNIIRIPLDDINTYAPLILAVDKELMSLMKQDRTRDEAYNFLLSKTKRYAEAIQTWPKEELRYVPRAAKWFSDKRYNQNELLWFRERANSGYEAEREQVARVTGSRN